MPVGKFPAAKPPLLRRAASGGGLLAPREPPRGVLFCSGRADGLEGLSIGWSGGASAGAAMPEMRPLARLAAVRAASDADPDAPGKRGTEALRGHGAPADRALSLIFVDGTSLDLCAETDLWRDRLVREMRALQRGATSASQS